MARSSLTIRTLLGIVAICAVLVFLGKAFLDSISVPRSAITPTAIGETHYRIYLFAARNGRLPQRLSDLPKRNGYANRTTDLWGSSPSPKPWNGSSGTVRAMKQVALSEVKDDLSKYLRLAETEEIVITRHGRPAGVLVGFGSEDDWFDYKLEHDPRFLRRIERARQSLREGKGVPIEHLTT
jgi:prevent-host-death family protein